MCQEKISIKCYSSSLAVQTFPDKEPVMPRQKTPIDYHNFSIRLRVDLLQVVRERALQEKRSVNAQIELIIERWVKSTHRKRGQS